MIRIRKGRVEDVEAVTAVDPIANAGDVERQHAIQHWLSTGETHLAVTSTAVEGYCALEYSFYGHGFVAMLMVAPGARQQGVGRALLQDAQQRCRTTKLFTSTNLSNQPMQRLLTSVRWRSVGIIYGLDEDDPELVFAAPASSDVDRKSTP